MVMMGWWDGTGIEAEEALAARVRSEASEAVLASLGWSRLGVMGLSVPIDGFHDGMCFPRINVWRSADGTVAAEVQRHYGRDAVELWSILEDGQILKSNWNEDGKSPGVMAYRHDPGEPMPRMLGWNTQASQARMAHIVANPSRGYELQYLGGGELADAVARHVAWVADGAAARGAAQRVELAGLGALEGRAAVLMLEGGGGASGGMVLAGGWFASAALAAVVTMVSLLVAPDVGVPPGVDLDALPEAERVALFMEPILQVMAPSLGVMLGAATGYLTLGVGRIGRWLGLGLMAMSIVPLFLADVALGTQVVSMITLRWDFAIPAVIGLLAGVWFATVGMKWSVERLQRESSEGGRKRASEVFEAYGAPRRLDVPPNGARPSNVPSITDDAPPPGSALGTVLTNDGFVPVGARRSGAPDSDVVAGVYVAPDGLSAAETLDVGEHSTLVLRSVLHDGTVIETRSLPDVGPTMVRPAKLSLGRATVPSDTVTARALAVHRWFPLSRVLRVQGRPRAGLSVAHAVDAASTRGLHAQRTEDLSLRPLTDHATAMQVGAASEAAQMSVPMDGVRTMLATMPALYLGLGLSMFGADVAHAVEAGGSIGIALFCSGLSGVTFTAWAGTLLVAMLHDQQTGRRTSGRFTLSYIAFGAVVVVGTGGAVVTDRLPDFLFYPHAAGWAGAAVGLLLLWASVQVGAWYTVHKAGPSPMPAASGAAGVG